MPMWMISSIDDYVLPNSSLRLHRIVALPGPPSYSHWAILRTEREDE